MPLPLTDPASARAKCSDSRGACPAPSPARPGPPCGGGGGGAESAPIGPSQMQQRKRHTGLTLHLRNVTNSVRELATSLVSHRHLTVFLWGHPGPLAGPSEGRAGWAGTVPKAADHLSPAPVAARAQRVSEETRVRVRQWWPLWRRRGLGAVTGNSSPCPREPRALRWPWLWWSSEGTEQGKPRDQACVHSGCGP